MEDQSAREAVGRTSDLRQEILHLKQTIEAKKKELIRLEEDLDIKCKSLRQNEHQVAEQTIHSIQGEDKLDNKSILKYSRQLILPEIGVKGQIRLKKSSVLIVGAGGLGCPSAIYLAAAGIGKLGLVDYDEVELSNLHRQILHTESRVGVQKSASAATACNELNNDILCVPYHVGLDSSNALDLIKQYDIVLDATDNVATRYLLNDACVLAGKPLVSGSALRFEGQLTVYNHRDGPCYRCLYPRPPPPETVTNCSDGGVIGVVPGIIGCIQALEAIKIAANMESSYSQKLLMFDALDGTFRTIRLRPRQKSCSVCGENPQITKLIDYEEFCGTKASDKCRNLSVLTNDERITVSDYKHIQEASHILVDVRQPVEMDICKLPNSTNQIEKPNSVKCIEDKLLEVDSNEGGIKNVFVVCRRGNDSQIAVRKLKEHFQGNVSFKDIKGGLTAWAKQIDKAFPVY